MKKRLSKSEIAEIKRQATLEARALKSLQHEVSKAGQKPHLVFNVRKKNNCLNQDNHDKTD